MAFHTVGSGAVADRRLLWHALLTSGGRTTPHLINDLLFRTSLRASALFAWFAGARMSSIPGRSNVPDPCRGPGAVPPLPGGARPRAPGFPAARQARPGGPGPADAAARLRGPARGARPVARGPGRLAAQDPGPDPGRHGEALPPRPPRREPGALAGGRSGPFLERAGGLVGRRPDLAQPGRRSATRNCCAWPTPWRTCPNRCARSSSSSTAAARRSSRSPTISARRSRRSPRCCGAAWKHCDIGYRLRSRPMSVPDQPSGSRPDPLDAVIAEYLQQVEAGAVPDRARPARPPPRAGRPPARLLRRLRPPGPPGRRPAPLRRPRPHHRSARSSPPTCRASATSATTSCWRRSPAAAWASSTRPGRRASTASSRSR